jgi:hypothetical protein
MKGVAGFVCMLLCGAGAAFAGEKTVFHVILTETMFPEAGRTELWRVYRAAIVC